MKACLNCNDLFEPIHRVRFSYCTLECRREVKRSRDRKSYHKASGVPGFRERRNERARLRYATCADCSDFRDRMNEQARNRRASANPSAKEQYLSDLRARYAANPAIRKRQRENNLKRRDTDPEYKAKKSAYAREYARKTQAIITVVKQLGIINIGDLK